jgi:hypothetical protein
LTRIWSSDKTKLNGFPSIYFVRISHVFEADHALPIRDNNMTSFRVQNEFKSVPKRLSLRAIPAICRYSVNFFLTHSVICTLLRYQNLKIYRKK